MTKRNSPGYLLPENPQPDENICVCVPVPKDERHIQAFLGQLVQLGYWYTWERDDDKTGTLAARAWRDIYQCVSEEINCIMSTGCGCGCKPEPVGQRINDQGFLEITYDGTTWEEQRAGDTRFSNPILPPISGIDGEDKRCRAANSITTGLEQEKIATEGRKQAGATFADLIAGVVAFLVGAGVITGGVSAVLAVITTLIAAFVAGIDAATFSGYFTPATWDALLCILYCNMNDDASFTEAQWQQIRAEVKGMIGGGAGDWIADYILSLGTVGLTNMARQELPGTKDCSGCQCAEGCNYKYQPFSPSHGIIVNRTETYVDVQATNPGNNVGYIILEAPVLGDCCYVNSITALGGGTVLGNYFIPCGTPYSEAAWIAQTPVGQCVQLLQIQTQVGQIFRFVMSECP